MALCVPLGLFGQNVERPLTLEEAVTIARNNNLTLALAEAEIDRVTTPGGLTIKGLNAMEAAGFTPSVIEGLRASTKR